MDKRILLPLVILPAFQTGNMQAADQPALRAEPREKDEAAEHHPLYG